MPRSKKAAPALVLTEGAFYWIAIDDGLSFAPIEGLPEGPHLVRLDLTGGEWRAVMVGRQGGNLEIGSNVQQRIVWGTWERNSLMGSIAYHKQEVRITWLGAVGEPPELPSEVEPVGA